MEQQPSKTEQFYLNGKKVSDLTLIECNSLIRLVWKGIEETEIGDVRFKEVRELYIKLHEHIELINRLDRGNMWTLESNLSTLRSNPKASLYSVGISLYRMNEYFTGLFKTVKRIKL